jgi:hypothetical protein
MKLMIYILIGFIVLAFLGCWIQDTYFPVQLESFDA